MTDHGLRLLGSQTWQLTLVIVIVAIIVRGVGRSRPQLAATLWLLVLMKAVTPPLWSSPVGLFSHDLLPPWRSLQAIVVDAPASIEKSGASSVRFVDSPQMIETLPGLPFPLSQESPINSKSSVVTPVETFVQDPLSTRSRSIKAPVSFWSALLLGIWLAGIATTALLIVGHLLRLWISLRYHGQLVRPAVEDQVVRLCRQLGIRQTVRVWITPSNHGPAVFGVFRPILLLPEKLVNQFSEAELEPILAHELLHIRRGDLWLGWWQALVQCVWWFHPLVWWGNRSLSRLLERCCDDDVLAEMNCEPSRYARSLLAALELKQQLRPVPMAPGVRPVELTSERMERIMRRQHGCRSRTPWWGWGLLGVGLILTLPGATQRLTANEDKAITEVVTKPSPPQGADSSRINKELPPNSSKTASSGETHPVTQPEIPQQHVEPENIFAWRLPSVPGIASETPVKIRLSGLRSTIAKEFLAKQTSPFDKFGEVFQKLPELLREEYRSRGYPFAVIEVHFELDSVTKSSPQWVAVVYINEGIKVLEQTWKDVEPGNPSAGKREQLRGELHPNLGRDHLSRAMLHRDYNEGFFAAARTGGCRCVQPGDSSIGLPAVYAIDWVTGSRFRIGGVTVISPASIQSASIKAIFQAELGQGSFFDRGAVTRTVAKIREANPSMSVGVAIASDEVSSTVQIRFELSPIGSWKASGRSTYAPILFASAPYKATSQLPGTPPSDPLAQMIDVAWIDRPLKDAVMDLAKQTRVNIVIEPNGLNEAGIKDDASVSLVLSKISLRSALRILCNTVGLGLREEEECYVLTSPERVEPYIAVAYPIVDLIILMPVSNTGEKPVGEVGAAHSSIHLRSIQLMELITSTVAPDSWASVGGKGDVKFFDGTISLVILQTQQRHEQITDVLIQLRRSMGIQTSFRFKEIICSAEKWQQLRKGTHDRFVRMDKQPSESVVNYMTAFNGQQITLMSRSTFIVSPLVVLMPVISEDRRTIALTFLPVKIPSLFQPLAVTVNDGESWLLDVSETLPTSDPRLRDGDRVILQVTSNIMVRESNGGERLLKESKE